MIKRLYYRYFVWRIPYWRRIQWFIQRGRRGYSDFDTWGLDYYLCEMLPQALRQLAKYNHGCHTFLYDNTRKDDECWKWKAILEKMAKGFEAGYKIADCDFKNKEDEEKLYMEFEETMCLFKKHFFGLWD